MSEEVPREKQPNPEGIKTRVVPGGGEKQGKGERRGRREKWKPRTRARKKVYGQRN